MRNSVFRVAAKMTAAIASLALCLTMSACSDSSDSDDSASSSDANQIAGITATGELGEKPTIKLHTPMSVEDGAYSILQEGDGETVEDGDRVCAQGVAINVEDGSELMSTWEDDTPDCSILVDSDYLSSTYYDVLKGQPINTTVAFGINENSSSSSSSTVSSYIMALTLVSKSRDLEKATGEEVTDVPADLPKVTRDEDGKPSIDMNGQGAVDELIAQTLIKGDGETLTDSSTAVVKYTGWLTDGTQFDSSWDRGTTFDADLSSSGSIIQGWKDGLIGQTVGSQVLLVIPADLAYGDSGSGDTIPGGATIVFVVDIVAAY
ncbi:FKBP-type peptidyl-prolyl cis-trans isomerase [Bifidobacterium eulemuris]|uniref:Peptidyl-prolyl cis-trans isomerase n=1 Tax=Bifidobacterium eulemuris TaxID=1765219 RepID=A0A261G3J2_9BIFI|nr:FKBP-type peptidyl-prolyl cis-trans isomerase [Bifidobacterium eulemuris]OZG65992.1 peptidylprolyl isomerase [Bifidobacterium eulemuris]QOL32048.1 FKBP-type peptidyl-prolyl cis-trans isomerase [Bifidobacterium eulemuris]